MKPLLAALGLCLLALPSLAQDSAPAPAIPEVRAELSAESVPVGQPVVLRISVLVPTWLPQPPVFPAIDLPNVIVRLPERATGPISERIGGETWSGVSRAYRLYPMVPGAVSLPPTRLTVTYADPDTTQPVVAEVDLPGAGFTATVPSGAEGLDPLVLGAGLTLEQTFEGGGGGGGDGDSEGTLVEGDALTRIVTARIEGTSALFLPPLVPPVTGDAARAYPKDPVVEETENRGTLSGSRTETVTYVAQYGGTLDLPAIDLKWFNVETNTVETASLPGRTLEVEAPARPVAPRITPRQVVLLAGAALLLALLGWGILRYVVPPLRRWRADRRAVWQASEGFAARRVEAEIGRKDLGGVYSALAMWDAHMPGAKDPALAAALAGLGAGRYGVSTTEPDGWEELSRAFRAARVGRQRQGGTRTAGLPALNPH